MKKGVYFILAIICLIDITYRIVQNPHEYYSIFGFEINRYIVYFIGISLSVIFFYKYYKLKDS